MDISEHTLVSMLPTQALSLRLARPPIAMSHGPTWKIDKVNPVHDLVVCLSGGGRYRIEGEDIALSPGEAMMIPAYTRFRGHHAGEKATYTGIAQHFSLDLFGREDVLGQMRLRRHVRLSNWPVLEPLVSHYRSTPSGAMATLTQHHQFMVILLMYLEDAFLGWREAVPEGPQSQDLLSMQIMFVASRLAADPVGSGVEEAMRSVSFNPDYFRRAFRDRIGMTPQKYRELKRMEFAVSRLGQGHPVKRVAAELGYSDPYFFSRMFKRYIGSSPSSYRLRRGGMDGDPPPPPAT
jgi:AraC-like DNA-binding protein/mannose-6-phosphate isomerase-like protein (cupin superfamily)